MQEHLVRALADLRGGIGEEVRHDVGVARDPRLAAVVRAEHAGRGEADVHPPAVARVELDRMAAHPAGAREPAVARRVLEQAAIHLPGLATVVRPEEHAGITPEIERPRLLRAAWLDVPGRLQ